MHADGRLMGFTQLCKASNTSKLLEYGISLDGTRGSPFRSAEIAVDAHVQAPSGNLLRVPAFFIGANAEGFEWRLRFAGVEPGEYTSTLILRVGDKETDRKSGPSFSLAQGAPGYIRRAKASQYFEFDNGSAYLPVGQNVCFTSAKAKMIPIWPDHRGYVPSHAPDLPWDKAYRRWFSRMGACGANWARLWMGSPEFDLMDGEPWVFNTDHAGRLDQLFDLAATHGIQLCLCLDYFRQIFHVQEPISTNNWFSGLDRVWGRLLRATGGQKHAEFFTSPAIEELLQDLIRYCVARWGCRTNLFAWELWNEIEGLADPGGEAAVAWVHRATAFLRQTDPWHHLIKSSAHAAQNRQYSGPEFGDLNDIHLYFGWTGTETAKDLARLIAECTTEIRQENHPFIIGEAGLAREMDTPEYGLVAYLADKDLEGVALHECLWAGLFVGGSGTGMVWWWDEHTDLKDQYWQFLGIARFVQDVPWNRASFTPGICLTSHRDLRAWELRSRDIRLVWLQSLHYTWWNAIHGARFSPIRDTLLTLDAVERGSYRIEWWNTETGAISAKTEQAVDPDGTLRIPIPEVCKDIALKVRRRESSET